MKEGKTKKARVKIKDLYQCCARCDTKMTLGDEVVNLGNDLYCSTVCSIEDNNGHCAEIESCFFDDGFWEIGDDDYFKREYKEEDRDLYEWRNAEIVEEEE